MVALTRIALAALALTVVVQGFLLHGVRADIRGARVQQTMDLHHTVVVLHDLATAVGNFEKLQDLRHKQHHVMLEKHEEQLFELRATCGMEHPKASEVN